MLKVLSDILLVLDGRDLPALVLLDSVDGLRHGRPLYRPTSSSTLDSRDRCYSGPERTWSAAGHYVEVRAGSTASSPAPIWYSVPQESVLGSIVHTPPIYQLRSTVMVFPATCTWKTRRFMVSVDAGAH